MSKQAKAKPRPAIMILTMLLTFLFIISMNALPAMRAGESTWEALRAIVQDPCFWREQMLPLGVMYLLMLFVFPMAYERLLRKRSGDTYRLSWSINRWLITLGGLVFIVGTAVPITLKLLRGQTFSFDQLAFTAILWLLYAGLILTHWVRKPSSEWVEGFETGDHSRSMDERYQVVMGKSAVTTLYWTLALLLVGGSLYEVLITRVWPARSLAETAIVFVLWNVIYSRVNRTV